ncbi:VOC family protein [Fontimonas sp. SYSU GA230001]|uniref:VOC family protein n=1 Tax=Fontimonas sp. SYSU GA230001 TaxID=3142450 RepID=UPI0032B5838D
MNVQTYLHFDGRCEEALDFYRKALGAEIGTLLRYKDSPTPAPPGMVPPGWDGKVMHAELRIGDSVVMASDDCTLKHAGFQGFQLAINVADAAEAERCFAALSAGGQVRMPLAETFFSPRFGMLTDRYGVSWMVMVASH